MYPFDDETAAIYTCGLTSMTAAANSAGYTVTETLEDNVSIHDCGICPCTQGSGDINTLVC